jgi:hypothetical protein
MLNASQKSTQRLQVAASKIAKLSALNSPSPSHQTTTTNNKNNGTH